MKRVNRGIFSRLEEKFQWKIVTKMPSWVTPDRLSALAFLSFSSSGWAYFLGGKNLNFLWLVNLFIFGHWFADGTDGKLAKFRRRSRPKYGYYLDHILDSAGVGLALGTCFIEPDNGIMQSYYTRD